MTAYILSINEIGADALPKVGGKGANLGELTRAGFSVPPGFCVTTDAFDQFMAEARDDIYQRLDGVSADDLAGASAIG
ncbi:MAG: phosphoenolpyruvate synthase, partial [Chloroflexi bacterium]|nr:phosphoenolpyruvate synthase [Chloroflexota bacterium]